MDFHKYHHIDNILKGKYYGNDEWIAMEKIDGSNLQFIVSENTIITGRRNDILKEDEKFANYQSIRELYREKLFHFVIL